jgi:hypothetical protein
MSSCRFTRKVTYLDIHVDPYTQLSAQEHCYTLNEVRGRGKLGRGWARPITCVGIRSNVLQIKLVNMKNKGQKTQCIPWHRGDAGRSTAA